MLGAEGVRAFLVDQTEALGLGAAAHLTPIATEGGPVAVPLDWATVARVWDPERGYPAHPAYRDYHHRTVFDHRPWANGGGTYDHEAALAQARRHAREFVAAIVERLDRHRSDVGRPGLVVCPLDTELLGHWWYEGPAWLAAVLAEAPRQGLALSTLSDALTRHPAVPRSLAPSSWGRPKDLSTWDGPPVAGLAALARGRELALVGRAPQAPAGRRGILARAARELLALQSSDWAFLATYRSAGPYPRERAHLHAAALDDCLGALTDSEPVAPPTEPALRNLAPALDLAPLLAP
jgi:1,4-alpha-glucan branching enzyme